jgi:phosphatidylserine/phosphatidylglycerophosphate/cardiolipin synthase-like enzyme
MKKVSEVHFENIRDKIITELRNAKFNIFIAVAWFTDKKLWVEVCNKAKNVQVQVLIIDDDINRNSNIDFNELVRNGGELFFADGNLHHKYCIIDLETTISGSYNWTHTANKRLKGESIEIKKNANKISREYAKNFKDLLLEGKKYSSFKTEILKRSVSLKDKILLG